MVDVATVVPTGAAGLIVVTLVGYFVAVMPAERRDTLRRLADERQQRDAADRRADKYQRELDVERAERRHVESELATTQATLRALQSLPRGGST